MRTRLLAAAAAALLALGLAACGDDDDDDAAPSGDATTTTESTGGTTTTAAAGGTTGTSDDDDSPLDDLDDIGELSGDCLDASRRIAEAYSNLNPTDLDTIGEIGDLFDALADEFPAIEDDLRTLADAYRDADSFTDLDGDVAEAQERVGEYFEERCT